MSEWKEEASGVLSLHPSTHGCWYLRLSLSPSRRHPDERAGSEWLVLSFNLTTNKNIDVSRCPDTPGGSPCAGMCRLDRGIKGRMHRKHLLPYKTLGCHPQHPPASLVPEDSISTIEKCVTQVADDPSSKGKEGVVKLCGYILLSYLLYKRIDRLISPTRCSSLLPPSSLPASPSLFIVPGSPPLSLCSSYHAEGASTTTEQKAFVQGRRQDK